MEEESALFFMNLFNFGILIVLDRNIHYEKERKFYDNKIKRIHR